MDITAMNSTMQFLLIFSVALVSAALGWLATWDYYRQKMSDYRRDIREMREVHNEEISNVHIRAETYRDVTMGDVMDSRVVE